MYFPGSIVRGVEDLWIIGDTFVSKSVRPYMLNRSTQDFYILTNFETSTMHGNINSDYLNCIGRIRNSLVNLINQKNLIPKWVLVVVEDDIINTKGYEQNRASVFFGKVLEHLMKEFNQIIDEFKSMIPTKAKKHDWPYFLWIVPTIHRHYFNLEEREKFNKCLTTVEALHDNVICLELEQLWNPTDRRIFLHDTQKFSSDGYNTFWKAVDKTLKFADTSVIRHSNKKMKDVFTDKRAEKIKRQQTRNTHYQNPSFSSLNRPPYNDRYHFTARENFSNTDNSLQTNTFQQERPIPRRRIDFDDPNQYRLPPPPPMRERSLPNNSFYDDRY